MRLDAIQFDFEAPLTDCSYNELIGLSALTVEELTDLIDCGAILPTSSASLELRFSASAVRRARIAARLRDDFALEMHAIALALLLLVRVHELEAQLQSLQVRLPAQRSNSSRELSQN